MNRFLRMAFYCLILGLLVLLVAGQAVWATPEQSPSLQTVPTATQRAPTAVPPTAVPPTAVPPTSAPNPTAAPAPTAVTVPAATASGDLVLAIAAGQSVVWPGATVPLTVTISNRGTGAARGLILTVTLPEGLDPAAGALPAGLSWDGRTLRGQLASLAAAERWTPAFAATVRRDVAPGKAFVIQAAVTAEGGSKASASVMVAQPPAELPVTGAQAAAAD